MRFTAAFIVASLVLAMTAVAAPPKASATETGGHHTAPGGPVSTGGAGAHPTPSASGSLELPTPPVVAPNPTSAGAAVPSSASAAAPTGTKAASANSLSSSSVVVTFAGLVAAAVAAF
ncbi:hypothetical protein BGX28_008889 [Mortierella sp. GBA30]|nr:hypothetical protein BGX28_008889 [Mortierella sp. GBA30]